MRGAARSLSAALVVVGLLGVAGCQQAPSDVGAANTETVQDGSPDGADLGDALVTVPDLDQPIDVRLWTLGPNPAGSPLSCDHNPTPSGTRLVPIYVNVTSDDPKHGAKDTSLKIAVRSGGVDRPLLLVTNYETYQSVCPEQPTVKVTGLDAGVQLVKRGVAVVSTTDRVATVIVSGTNGFTEQATIRVQPRHVTRRPDSPLVRDCAGLSDTVMPARLVLACGDGSIQAAIARWRTWYLNAASGRGRVLVNSCQPDCAGGRPVAYPAVFTLTSPTTVGSRLYFTELRIHFVGPAPGPRHSVTCPLATPRAIGGCVGPIYGR